MNAIFGATGKRIRGLPLKDQLSSPVCQLSRPHPPGGFPAGGEGYASANRGDATKLGSIEAAALRSSGPRLWTRIFEFADAAARRLVPLVSLSRIRQVSGRAAR